MKLSATHYTLPLRHPFTLGNGSTRTHTPVTIVELHYGGLVGYGEAAMPPYLGEDHNTVSGFLQQVDTKYFNYPFDFHVIHKYIDELSPGHSAAKAAIDIALHDLWGKIAGNPLWQLLQIDLLQTRPTTFTIGIANSALVEKKVREGLGYGFGQFKAKLGGNNDKEIITTIRRVTDKPLFADVNQGWTNKEAALDMISWLKEQGVSFIEQPFAKDNISDQAWLVDRSPLPVFADEACQRYDDVERLKHLYHGINIKLMKSTGIYEAMRMLKRARELGMQAMIGCMTETSCATLAAATIAPFFDYTDLDGPWILAEQPFQLPFLDNGLLQLSARPGLGV